MLILLFLPFLLAANAESDVFIDAVRAVRDGDGRLGAAAAVSLIMIGLATARDKVAWLRGDRGGAVMVLAMSLGGALITSIGSGAPIDYKLFLTAIEVALASVGGYTWVRRMIWPVPSTPLPLPLPLPLPPPTEPPGPPSDADATLR